MRKEYNKLIRDRIPEIIEAAGQSYALEEIPDDQVFRELLFQKLVEEVAEVIEAAPDKIATELADLYEVMDAIRSLYGISEQQVIELQTSRRSERGGFQKRLKLLWVEE